jgi:ribonuclease P protein component
LFWRYCFDRCYVDSEKSIRTLNFKLHHCWEFPIVDTTPLIWQAFALFLIYETPISTIEDPAQASARVSEPQFQQKRPCHPGQSPPTGPQAPHAGLIGASMTAQTPRRLRLPRGSRVTQNRDFLRIRQQGERLAQGCLVANWNFLPEGAGPKLGVVTSRKIGGAVQRTRARRLLRESFRLHQHDFAKPVEIILVARNSIVGKQFADVEKDFLTTLRRAGLLRNEA